MTDETMVLAGDFAAFSRDDWDREVLKALNRRRPPGKELTLEQALRRLTTLTPDGVQIEPLYTAAESEPAVDERGPGQTKPADASIGLPGQVPFTRGSRPPGPGAAWTVEPLHEDGDVARTAEAILADLNAGAAGVWLRLDTDAIAPGDLAAVLADVQPAAIAIDVSSISQQAEAAEALLDIFAHCGAGEVHGNLGIDPLAQAAVTGQPADLSRLGSWVERARPYPGVRALTVDVTPYDNAGVGDAEQLAFAIAGGVEYVRALEAQGVAPAEAFAQIVFRVSLSADEFLTIARLRALRRLWARVGQVVGVPEAERGAIQHGVTSWRVLSKDDPWVNLLRATVGAFSASVGGAETITVLPHDTALGLPTGFSRRIARNIALLVAEESHVGAAQDPAGGAWTFEALTDQLADKAWSRLQMIEAAGGLVQALQAAGASPGPSVVERARRIATRQLPLTGVSMFPLQGEVPLTDVIPRPARPAYAGLKPRRDAEVFEALRQRARAYAAVHGDPPRVILACLGSRRDFGPRQQFTTNLLLAGGLDFIELETPAPAEIAATAGQTDTSLVILASSATVYADQALAAATAARSAGCAVWIAGRRAEAGDGADALIDGEIFDGMDVVAFLDGALEKLGA